ncbi:MAG: I78 family peptidase inhibitor [Cypionkella sp.]
MRLRLSLRVIQPVPFVRNLASLQHLSVPILWLLVGFALSGCVLFRPDLALGPVDRMIPTLPDHCKATELSALTGQNFTSLADQPLVADLRVVWPTQPVSADLDSTRLNAQVDASGRIRRLFCG